MTKSLKYFLLAPFILFSVITTAHSQCGCIGGAAVGGSSVFGGTSNIGVLSEGTARATASIIHSYGNKYFTGSKLASSEKVGTVEEYSAVYSGLMIGYGITDKLTFDFELGFFPNKMQDFGTYKLSGSGFSHSTIYGKYNLYSNKYDQIFWSVGLGAKLPLETDYQNLPQNIRTSNGAFGAVLLNYFHKGFIESEMNLIMINRIDINAENNSDYQYGTSFINSAFVTKSIIEDLTGILEIRSDVKLRDRYLDEEVMTSGWNNVILSPQINYSFSDFNVSAFYDIPVYKYYNDTQLTNKQNIGISLTWQSKVF